MPVDQGPRGKVVDYRSAIEINGIRIEPGTLIFGDKEGVLIIPREAEAEAIRLSLKRRAAKSWWPRRSAAAAVSAAKAFETYGIMWFAAAARRVRRRHPKDCVPRPRPAGRPPICPNFQGENDGETWRWFGPDDPTRLAHIRQTGARCGIVTSLHHVAHGEVVQG